MHFIIYKTTNKVDGCYYIGQHITECLEDGYLGSGTVLKRCIKKYGKENFSREILAHADNAEQLNALEAFYVGWDEVNSRSCYNLKTGGGAKGQLCKESRQKISDAQKGREFSLEHREAISVAMSGRKYSAERKRAIGDKRRGQTHTTESKNKISSALKGKPKSEEHRAKLLAARRKRAVQEKKAAAD